jgi:hypothetical protein
LLKDLRGINIWLLKSRWSKINQVNYKILEQIATQKSLKLTLAAGLADSDLKIAFESGANQITGGSDGEK